MLYGLYPACEHRPNAMLSHLNTEPCGECRAELTRLRLNKACGILAVTVNGRAIPACRCKSGDTECHWAVADLRQTLGRDLCDTDVIRVVQVGGRS